MSLDIIGETGLHNIIIAYLFENAQKLKGPAKSTKLIFEFVSIRALNLETAHTPYFPF